jgi:uncharacterized protein YhjY with autotransporter beta-barrel domain
MTASAQTAQDQIAMEQLHTVLPQLAIQSLDAVEAHVHDILVERRDREMAGDQPVVGKLSMTVFGDFRAGHYSQFDNEPSTITHSRSISAALDYAPREGIIAGVSAGVDGIDARLAGTGPEAGQGAGQRVGTTSWHVGPYLGVSNGRVYFDTSVNYASARYNERFDASGNQVLVTGARYSDSWAISGETGYHLRKGKVNVQPFAGLHYRYAHVPQMYQTTGTTTLATAPFANQSLRSAVGLRISENYAVGSWSLQPVVSAEWRHELRHQVSTVIEEEQITPPSPVYTLPPGSFDRNAALVNLGVSATYHERLTVRLNYRGEFTDGRRIHGLVASISHRF